MRWYLEVMKKYAVFGGRASRQEYWMFYLMNILVTIAAILILFGVAYLISSLLKVSAGLFFGFFCIAYSIAVIVPSIALTVRRLHDTNRSGWWHLIVFVPFVGAIILLVLMATAGEAKANRFGEVPA